MKRTAGMCVLLAVVGGCVTADSNHGVGQGCSCNGTAAAVPGVQGPWGQPVTMMQAGTGMPAQASSGVVQANGNCPDGKCMAAHYTSSSPSGSGDIIQAHLPVKGPVAAPGGIMSPPGAVAGVGPIMTGAPNRYPAQRTSVRFLRPEGMKVSWYVPSPDGRPTFSTTQLDTPGRYNFTQGAIYRLKLSHLPNRPNIVALYPTLEVAPANNRTAAFLAHSAVPVIFTDEDFDQVAAGNYLVKVIYLPDPQFQDIATAGPDEVVSTRLDPGVDPVAEARRRGTVLLAIRMGNIDLEAPNTPSMEAPNPYMMHPMAPPPARAPGQPMTMAPQHPMMLPQAPIMAPQAQAMSKPMVLTNRLPSPATTTAPAPETAPAPTPPEVTTLPAPLDSPPAANAGTTKDSTKDTSSFDKRPSLRRRLFSGSTDN